VIRKRLGRFLTVSTSAVLALTLLGVGAASAAPPMWVMTVKTLPGTVSPGADAGYRVTITNNGPSNISALFLVSDQTAEPSYVSAPSQGTCNPTGALFCSFGALADDQSVVVTVAYTTPLTGNSFGVIFQANTTGNTFSDVKGRSHGDTLFASPKVTSTALSNDPDFAGGFVIDETSFANDQDVRRQNPQATSIDNFQSLVPVTIEDDLATDPACTIPACSGAFGQWSSLSVAEGTNYRTANTPFKVTLLVWGGAAPGNTSNVYVLHVPDVGTPYVIDQICTFGETSPVPTNAECINVMKVGSNLKIEVWLFQNGFVRGGI
jgi:hypothetical protein